jgi:hypothetical protein
MEIAPMSPKEVATMCMRGTIGGLVCGWAAGRPEWMYSFADPSLYGISELAMLFVGSLLMIQVSLWLIKNKAAP